MKTTETTLPRPPTRFSKPPEWRPTPGALAVKPEPAERRLRVSARDAAAFKKARGLLVRPMGWTVEDSRDFPGRLDVVKKAGSRSTWHVRNLHSMCPLGQRGTRLRVTCPASEVDVVVEVTSVRAEKVLGAQWRWRLTWRQVDAAPEVRLFPEDWRDAHDLATQAMGTLEWPVGHLPNGLAARRIFLRGGALWTFAGHSNLTTAYDVPCPFGEVGTRLWVAERWGVLQELEAQRQRLPQRLLRTAPSGRQVAVLHFGAAGGDAALQRWWPAASMPRWASRSHLVVTAIRVVQDAQHGCVWQVSWRRVDNASQGTPLR